MRQRSSDQAPSCWGRYRSAAHVPSPSCRPTSGRPWSGAHRARRIAGRGMEWAMVAFGLVLSAYTLFKGYKKHQNTRPLQLLVVAGILFLIANIFLHSHTFSWTHTLTNLSNSLGPDMGSKTYSYDANGNTLGYTDDQNANERKILWDEENRLGAIADNGKIHHYIYDAGGNRTIKAKGDNQLININGVNTGGEGTADNYTMYVFPHFTVHNSKYTKHFFVGSQRILSKLGQPGTIDDIAIIEKVNGNGKIDWGLKQGNTNDHIQGHIKWVGEDGQVMTAGKSGKIPPGILKKYSDLPEDSLNNGTVDKYERNQNFFHPDHLGNTSFITDASGEVSQHTEYLPFGEILVDDRPVNDKNMYLFKGKELDEETGLYYSGARYLDAQVGRFLNVDPKEHQYPDISPYSFVGGNPIQFTDPRGEVIVDPKTGEQVVKVNGQWQTASGGAISNEFIKNTLPVLDKLTASKTGTKIYDELQNIRTTVVIDLSDKENVKALKKGGNSRLRTGDGQFTTGEDNLYNNVIITPDMSKIEAQAKADRIDFEEKLIQTMSVEKDHIATKEQIAKEKGYDYNLFSSPKVVEDAYGSLLQNAVQAGKEYRKEKGQAIDNSSNLPIERVNKATGSNIPISE